MRLLAAKHQIHITSYEELASISLITDGYFVSIENNKSVSEYVEKIGLADFISVSDFNRLSGNPISVSKGEYVAIVADKNAQSSWSSPDELNKITHPVTMQSQSLRFAGTVEYLPLTGKSGFRYLLSDEDYALLSKGIPNTRKHNYVFFNVVNPMETYAFAKELKDEIILRSSQDVAQSNYYDEFAHEENEKTERPIGRMVL